MLKIKTNLSWVPSTSPYVTSQKVEVIATDGTKNEQSLDKATSTFEVVDLEKTSFTVNVYALTDKNTSVPLTIAVTTPAIADIVIPDSPTNFAATYEVVDV